MQQVSVVLDGKPGVPYYRYWGFRFGIHARHVVTKHSGDGRKSAFVQTSFAFFNSLRALLYGGDFLLNPTVIAIQIVSAIFLSSVGITGVTWVVLTNLWVPPHHVLACILYGILFIICANALCIGLLLSLASFRTLTKRIALKPSGLVVRRLCCQSNCCWKELKRIRKPSMRNTLPNHLGLGAIYDVATLEFSDGVEIAFGPEITSRLRILSIAERVLVRMKLSTVLRQIAVGTNVSFRSVAASSVGLYCGPRLIRWNDVVFVHCRNKEVIVIGADNGNKLSLSVGKTDNVCLLLSVIRVKTGIPTQGTQ